ncbi:hypothetical protein DFA_00733 [Cavenderia fasciculata]|uniref:Uncharacterized protein n=1 Tax=Cavenderia fasciculata TaxID=261658 RepID=F4PTI6_CACFS|nr:uncharacterized protein DFA_00733 [Cavenderia fasciculata]EGG20868.1 hypothetical protein DFA_00733 [Cavenderia fasciculata]|eukprot:XP_004358718.1 hypothetical protein DFA_00733 [Cavenderia fasciculata]
MISFILSFIPPWLIWISIFIYLKRLDLFSNHQFKDLLDVYEKRKGTIRENDCNRFSMEPIIRTKIGSMYQYIQVYGVRLYYDGFFVVDIEFEGREEPIPSPLQRWDKISITLEGIGKRLYYHPYFRSPKTYGNQLLRSASVKNMNRLIKAYLNKPTIIYHLDNSDSEHLVSFVIDGRLGVAPSQHQKFEQILQILGYTVDFLLPHKLQARPHHKQHHQLEMKLPPTSSGDSTENESSTSTSGLTTDDEEGTSAGYNLAVPSVLIVLIFSIIMRNGLEYPVT